ncbi:MAG: OsmC family protein [Gemmatimonadota bacterium]
MSRADTDAAAGASGAATSPLDDSSPIRVDAQVAAEWLGQGMRFVSQAAAAPAVVVDGDGVAGPSPMQLLLHSLAGCTASDIVDIAAKMRLPMSHLTVSITATRAEQPPRRYTAIRFSYRARGIDPADEDKLGRAVTLSHEKYCSALHSLREDIDVRFDVHID